MSADLKDTSSILNKYHSLQNIVKQLPSQYNVNQQFKKLVRIRLLTENCLIFLLQYSGLMIGTLNTSFSPVWLASGTACGFIFLRGPTVLPGIWLGTWLAYSLSSTNLILASSYACAYSLQSYFLFYFCHRYITPTLIFYHKATVCQFIFLVILVTGIITGWLVTLSYPVTAYSALTSDIYLRTWLANLNGILIFACALITYDAYLSQITLLRWRQKQLLTMFGWLTLLMMIWLFYPIPWMFFGFVILVAMSSITIGIFLGRCGAISSVFLVGSLLTFGAYFEAPLFVSLSTVHLLLLQFMVMFIATLGLLTGNELNEV